MRPIDLKSRICDVVAGGLTKGGMARDPATASNTLPSTDPPRRARLLLKRTAAAAHGAAAAGGRQLVAAARRAFSQPQLPRPIGFRCSQVRPLNSVVFGTFWTQPL